MGHEHRKHRPQAGVRHHPGRPRWALDVPCAAAPLSAGTHTALTGWSSARPRPHAVLCVVRVPAHAPCRPLGLHSHKLVLTRSLPMDRHTCGAICFRRHGRRYWHWHGLHRVQARVRPDGQGPGRPIGAAVVLYLSAAHLSARSGWVSASACVAKWRCVLRQGASRVKRLVLRGGCDSLFQYGRVALASQHIYARGTRHRISQTLEPSRSLEPMYGFRSYLVRLYGFMTV